MKKLMAILMAVCLSFTAVGCGRTYDSVIDFAMPFERAAEENGQVREVGDLTCRRFDATANNSLISDHLLLQEAEDGGYDVYDLKTNAYVMDEHAWGSVSKRYAGAFSYFAAAYTEQGATRYALYDTDRTLFARSQSPELTVISGFIEGRPTDCVQTAEGKLFEVGGDEVRPLESIDLVYTENGVLLQGKAPVLLGKLFSFTEPDPDYDMPVFVESDGLTVQYTFPGKKRRTLTLPPYTTAAAYAKRYVAYQTVEERLPESDDFDLELIDGETTTKLKTHLYVFDIGSGKTREILTDYAAFLYGALYNSKRGGYTALGISVKPAGSTVQSGDPLIQMIVDPDGTVLYRSDKSEIRGPLMRLDGGYLEWTGSSDDATLYDMSLNRKAENLSAGAVLRGKADDGTLVTSVVASINGRTGVLAPDGTVRLPFEYYSPKFYGRKMIAYGQQNTLVYDVLTGACVSYEEHFSFGQGERTTLSQIWSSPMYDLPVEIGQNGRCTLYYTGTGQPMLEVERYDFRLSNAGAYMLIRTETDLYVIGEVLS